MADNPLSSLIQLVLLLFVIWSILVAMFAVITNKHLANVNKENTELRAKLAKHEQPQEPEWVQYLFNDQPSDPAISALN